MKLSTFITEDRTKAAVLFNSKKRLFEYISELTHQVAPNITAQECIDALMQREKLGSTGIGNGIAIPHGRLEGIDETIAFLIVNEKPIPFDAIDDKPVDIFLALMVPEAQCQEHLKTLANIAQKLKDKHYCKQLRHAQTNAALFQIINQD